jgi:hypothetical protein
MKTASCPGLSRVSTCYGIRVREDVDGRDEPGHDGESVITREPTPYVSKILFIIFVDAIFTTSIERLFTNVFVVIGARSANACVYRAHNAD